MNFGEAIQSGFQNYVNFSGRSQRSAYWFWVLFAFLASAAAAIIDGIIFGYKTDSIGLVQGIVALGLLLPHIAIGVRRLHDIDRTGWWYLLVLTGIGAILLIIWFCFKGTSGQNRFGPDPLAGRT